MTKLLTSDEVQDRCRVGYSTLYRWRKSGIFPESVGVGKLLWTEQQITEWIKARSPPPEKTFDQRQTAADMTLQRHANNR
jgi:predicted DNA-binding transcriptional regulator AlpA